MKVLDYSTKIILRIILFKKDDKWQCLWRLNITSNVTFHEFIIFEAVYNILYIYIYIYTVNYTGLDIYIYFVMKRSVHW